MNVIQYIPSNKENVEKTTFIFTYHYTLGRAIRKTSKLKEIDIDITYKHTALAAKGD